MTEEKIILKSEMKYSSFYLVIFISFFFCCLSSYFYFLEGRRETIIYILFSFFSLIGTYTILSYNEIVIANEYFKVYSLLGYVKKKIYFNDVLVYTAIKKRNAKYKYDAEYIEWEELTLYTKDTKVKLYSTSYLNYGKLKKSLTKKGKRDVKKEKEWQKRNSRYWGLGMMISGIFLIMFFCFVLFKGEGFSNSILFFVLIFSYFIYAGRKLYLKNK
ncbi:hypothetical protein [Tenacibaculum aiptasiae]|uniref:hypothetical protein n=1 Tax=Tenacibaculum aiptasiae TaxID=426481 RepID=UPI00232F41E9|nr:hypothetical protein [Tenacibaculum aiptasiae]